MLKKNHPMQLDTQEEIFFNKINDMIKSVLHRGIPKYSAFLDIRQQNIAAYALNTSSYKHFMLYGGYDDSERMVLGVGEDKASLKIDTFPITPITVRFPKNQKLSHRDFLGALMGLMIKRAFIGDIIIGEGVGVLYVLSSTAPMIISELIKVGNTPVECTQGLPENFFVEKNFVAIDGTVSSLRLDCVVSHLIDVSRDVSNKLISSGKISRNAQVLTESAKTICLGDIISIRGYGKFILENIGSINKKGRIRIYCKKYT